MALRRCSLPSLAALVVAPALAHAQEQVALRVTADQTTVQVPEWGSDCGPRPESRTGASGREARATLSPNQLVVQDGRRSNRSDGCWSDNPNLRRISASHPSENRWTVVCATPQSDYQREDGTYTITLEAERLTVREQTEYAWQLRGSRCRATAVRTLVYARTTPAATRPDAAAAPVDAATAAVTPAARCATVGPPVRLAIAPSRRSLAPGGRGCFRARLFDARQCELPAAQVNGVTWQLARRTGAAGAEASLDGACVRAPSNSTVGEYTVVATLGALSDRAVAAVVSAEELRSLVARHFEDESSAAPIAPTGAPSGTGVGAVVLRAPAPPERGTPAFVWALIAAAGVLGAVAVALLARRRQPASPIGPEPESSPAPPQRPRRDAVPLPLPEPEMRATPSSAAPASPPTAAASAEPIERPRTKRCPVCDQRFTAEMAFCPEHGSTLVAVEGAPVVPPVPAVVRAPAAPATAPATTPSGRPPPVVRAAPLCPVCHEAVEGGLAFCPRDGTPVAPDATPLVCPQCGKRYPVGVVFCGQDGGRLTPAA